VYCLRFIIVVYYINGLLFEKNIVEIWHSIVSCTKNTLADCLVPEKAHMFSTKSDFCSIVYASYIWRIERQPQQLLLYKGLVAGMMTEEWLTADIMLEEQLCRYRYRGVHNWKYTTTEECLTADITLQERLCRYRYRGVHNWNYT
jgi:hypothetical protein